MTRRTNARLAGFTFLFYIVTGLTSMVLSGQTTRGAEGTAAKLASIAGHAPLVRLTVVLTLLTFFAAVVLAVALYALTRDQDPDLAVVALCCRVGEGVIGATGFAGGGPFRTPITLKCRCFLRKPVPLPGSGFLNSASNRT